MNVTVLVLVLIPLSMAFGGAVVFAVMSLKLAAVHQRHAEDWGASLKQIRAMKQLLGVPGDLQEFPYECPYVHEIGAPCHCGEEES